MSRELQPCGTWAAYERHRTRGEEACGPCKAANREKGREAMARHRARKQAREEIKSAVHSARMLPIVVPGVADLGPCTRMENGHIWDGRGEAESAMEARDRLARARLVCVTACLVFDACRAAAPADSGGGVWAGRVRRG